MKKRSDSETGGGGEGGTQKECEEGHATLAVRAAAVVPLDNPTPVTRPWRTYCSLSGAKAFRSASGRIFVGQLLPRFLHGAPHRRGTAL